MLVNSGINVLHAISDADTLIVETAITLAKQKDTCIIGSDTDLLILSVNSVYKSNNLKKLYIRSERKSNIQERTRLIQELVNKLGDVCCKYILFSHAFLGCDTTSHVFGFGKPQILKMFDNEDFVKIAEMFQSPNSSKEEITVASEKCFLMVYKSRHLTNSLNELRYIRFHQKVCSKTAVLPHALPSTSAAAKYHGLYVHYQMMEWCVYTEFSAEEWGWEMKNGKLLPITTDRPPAPEMLLKCIHCNCKKRYNINSNCSCRRHRLQCSMACGNCRGVGCENRQVVDFYTDNDIDCES